MTWNDVTINKFNQITDILTDPDFDDQDRILYYIQILFGVDPYKLSLSELKYFIKQVTFIGQKIPKMKLMDKYKLGYNTYRLSKKLEDFTVAQWMDYQTFLREGGSGSDNFPRLLSVFLIPDGKKEYNEDYDIDKVREDIDKYMTIPDALAISDFFVKRQTGLSIVLVSFIKKTALATRMPRQQRTQVRKEWRKAMRDIIGDLHRYL